MLCILKKQTIIRIFVFILLLTIIAWYIPKNVQEVSATLNKGTTSQKMQYLYNGHKYKVFTGLEYSWNKAQDYCKSLGGHLVTITSKEENKFLNSIVKNNKLKNMWIGAEKKGENFKWVTGEKWSYTNWDAGEPNNVFNMQNAVMMYTASGKWNDENGEGRDWEGYTLADTGFICEWEFSGTNDTQAIQDVTNMLKRTNYTTLPMSEYNDPNEIVLDYFSNSDLAKMVVTITGTHLSSHAMWQEAYRRALTNMYDNKKVMEYVSQIEFIHSIYGEMEGMLSRAFNYGGISASNDTISAIVAGLSDSAEYILADTYILEAIYNSAKDDDLKVACQQILQMKMTKFYTEMLKETSAMIPGLAKQTLEEAGKYFTKDFLSVTSKTMKGLGYTCKALGYVGTVLFIKDIVTKANGWSDLTEAYQDSIADAHIKNALLSAYKPELNTYLKGDKSKAATIGMIYKYIETVVKDGYGQIKTVLDKKYTSVLNSDSYLKNRIKNVNNMNIKTYTKSTPKYMVPKIKAYTLAKGSKKTIKASNVRYGVKVKYKVISGSKYITVNSKGLVTAKKPGTAIVQVLVYQNGGKKYTLKSKIMVKGNETATAVWKKFLTSKKYKKYTKEWPIKSLQYVITDLNADHNPELLITSAKDQPFFYTWTFTLNNSKIILADERYGYGYFRYSPSHNAIIASPELRPSLYDGAAPFYRLQGKGLKFLFQVGRDRGVSFYSDGIKKRTISEAERQSYYSDAVNFKWKKI